MSMISDLVDRLRVESKSMGKYGVDYMATLLMQASDTIIMLSEKARADRPQGEWIETPDGTMCGSCHKFPYDDGEYHIANWSSDFCPHCGARMKGANNGEDIQSTDE